MRANSLNHFKSIFSHHFFVRPADQNYYLARWTRINGFGEEFFWQSLQAIEKYLKASLVTNDVPTKGYGHNIQSLFETHLSIFGDLALHSFVKPQDLSPRLWRSESVQAFIRRINIQGAPDSRYGLISWFYTPSDLFKLDQLVFSLRRLTVGLDWIVGADWQVREAWNNMEGQKFRAALANLPEIQVRGPIEVPENPTDISGNLVSDALYSWNFSLARTQDDVSRPAPSTVAPLIGQVRNSYLYLLWEYLHSSSSVEDSHVLDGVHWLIKNVPLGQGTAEALTSAIKDRDASLCP